MRGLIFCFSMLTLLCSFGQNDELQYIRISKMYAVKNYDGKYVKADAKRTLTYSLLDSSFTFQKKQGKNIKKLDVEPSPFFNSKHLYFYLDSIQKNISDYDIPGGKYESYFIEMIYVSPSKLRYGNHRIESMLIRIPIIIIEERELTLLEKLRDEYYKIRKAGKVDTGF